MGLKCHPEMICRRCMAGALIRAATVQRDNSDTVTSEDKKQWCGAYDLYL